MSEENQANSGISEGVATANVSEDIKIEDSMARDYIDYSMSVIAERRDLQYLQFHSAHESHGEQLGLVAVIFFIVAVACDFRLVSAPEVCKAENFSGSARVHFPAFFNLQRVFMNASICASVSPERICSIRQASLFAVVSETPIRMRKALRSRCLLNISEAKCSPSGVSSTPL